MDDHEIQSTVESILGPGVKVVDCEKKSSVREEEVLLINGVPIPLEGPDGVAIREAMITGQVPPCDLLNQILVKAGILRYHRGSSSDSPSVEPFISPSLICRNFFNFIATFSTHLKFVNVAIAPVGVRIQWEMEEK